VEISPAVADAAMTQVIDSAIRKRFIELAPRKSDDARILTSERIEQLREVLARRGLPT